MRFNKPLYGLLNRRSSVESDYSLLTKQYSNRSATKVDRVRKRQLRGLGIDMRIRQEIGSFDGGDTGSERDPQFVASLKRGLDVLMALARSGRSLSTGELAARTNLPKATITRLTYTLVKLGHAIYDPRTGRYSTGAASVQLGYGALGGNAVLRIAQPHMRTIANRLNVSVAMGECSGLEMVYVGNETRDGPVGPRLFVGAALPIQNTAMGHAYLSGIDPARRARLLKKLEDSDVKAFKTALPFITASLHQFAECSYCIVAGRWDPLINGVGIPLTLAAEGRTVAFTASGLVRDTPVERLRDVVAPALRTMIDTIEQGLHSVD
jgi:DNA-binding IclR family transcriptional regulator